MAGKRVLIADEHQPFASSLASGFRQLGYSVVYADSMEAAIAGAQEFSPHLAVSEEKIATSSWYEVFGRLRAANVVIPWVIVTASGSIAAAVTAVRLGAAAYLAKPVTASNIVDALGHCKRVEPRAGPRPIVSQYCSLERAKWEYVNMTVVAAGSIAEAARRLKVG